MILILLLTFAVTAAPPPEIRAIVFDCDGVLVDSEGQKYEAWREVLHKVGVTLTRKEYLRVVGLDNHAILKRIAERHQAKLSDGLIEEKERLYHAKQKTGLTLIKPAVAFVRYLAEHRRALGVKLGLASSAARAEIAENLRQAGLTDAFDQVASGLDDLKDVRDPNGTNKPAPYIYREIARRLGVEAATVLVFEDSAAGATSALRANMLVVAVPNAYTRQQNFTGALQVTDLNAAPEDLMNRVFAAPTRPLRLAK